MKRPGCTFNSSCVFGNATKVDYYGGTSLSLVTNPYYIDDANVPRIPITHDGNIDTVKSYFGSTGTMNTILNGLAGNQGTTQYGLVKNKTFTIGGVTKSGWSSDYLLPSGTTNRIPWVIVYEPIVKMHLKDRVNTVAFTATEYVISAEYGWYDWYKSGGKGQNVGIVPYRHLPSSVQLEESWFGYPVYPTRNDSYKWSVEEVIKGGGWGMRWLPIAIQEPVNHGKDFSVSIIDYEATPKVGETTSVKIRWENNTATAGTVPVELWMGSSKIWSSEKTLPGKTAVTSTLQLSYATTGTKNMTAKINYDKRSEETNPNNNIASFTVNPYAPAVEIDYGVYFGAVEQPQPNSYADVTVNWKNYKSTGGTVLCELFRDDVLIWSGLKTFTGYQLITQTFSVYYSGSNSRTLTARINYANRDSETDPSDNSRTTSVILSTPLDSTYDFSVSDIAVTPETLYQGGLATVSFISDNWNRDISYDGILVEVLVDGTVVKSESVSFSAYGRNSHSYTVRMEDYGTQTVTARINWTNRFSERNSSNNIDQTSVLVNKYYEFSVSSLSVTPSTLYEDESVTISFRTDSWDEYNDYTNIPVQILYNGKVVYTEYVDYPAYGVKYHTATINGRLRDRFHSDYGSCQLAEPSVGGQYFKQRNRDEVCDRQAEDRSEHRGNRSEQRLPRRNDRRYELHDVQQQQARHRSFLRKHREIHCLLLQRIFQNGHFRTDMVSGCHPRERYEPRLFQVDGSEDRRKKRVLRSRNQRGRHG